MVHTELEGLSTIVTYLTNCTVTKSIPDLDNRSAMAFFFHVRPNIDFALLTFPSKIKLNSILIGPFADMPGAIPPSPLRDAWFG